MHEAAGRGALRAARGLQAQYVLIAIEVRMRQHACLFEQDGAALRGMARC